MPPSTDPALLKTREVAALFGVDPKTVHRWVWEGKLASITTPGGQHRFREADIKPWLEGRTPSANQQQGADTT